MEEQLVSYPCIPPLQGAAANQWCGVMWERAPRVTGEGWAKRWVHSPSFSDITCALQSACALQHKELSGSVVIPRDCLCLVHRSATAAPCDGDGGSVSYLFHVSHKRKEPGGAEKHPQHPAGVEAAEIWKAWKWGAGTESSWEVWALNQYPGSLVHRTSRMHGLIYGVVMLELIYLTTKWSFISY